MPIIVDGPEPHQNVATYPTPWVVYIVQAAEGDTYDDYGNPIPGDDEAVAWNVYGWGPGGSEELTGWSSQVTSDLRVYGPVPPVVITPQNQLLVEGVRYEVNGVVEDFTRGPFGFAPGVRVNLERVAG
jgi:hypothetical protein